MFAIGSTVRERQAREHEHLAGIQTRHGPDRITTVPGRGRAPVSGVGLTAAGWRVVLKHCGYP